MPRIEQRRMPLMLVVVVALFFLFALMLDRKPPADRWLTGVWLIYPAFWGALAVRQMNGARYLLTPEVLVICADTLLPRVPAQLVPLAGAELKRTRQGWYIRWKEGRIGRASDLKLSAAFGEALERAHAAALSAPPGSCPVTVQEAGWAVKVEEPAPDRRLWLLWSALALVGLGAAVWHNQPLYAAPLVGILVWAYLVARGELLLLDREALWLLAPGQEPRSIPVAAMTGLAPAGAWTLAVQTGAGVQPEFRLRAEGNLAARLRRWLAGEE